MKVFISHQKEDRADAESIANYLRASDIDVYFDEYDRELRLALINDNPAGVVEAIKKGVKSSTHMIVIVSKNTMNSKWVPFEIGYGYEALEIHALTLKDIKKSEIPDYIKVIPIIRDIYDIEKYISKLGFKSVMKSHDITSTFSSTHLLSGVMDTFAK